MTNQPERTQNFNGSMSGIIGSEIKEDGKVILNTFNQTNNTSNANTDAILALITQLRQRVAQFPAEVQEDLIIDIDDVEAEIKKPEGDRNLPKIKKRLLALAAAVTLIATPVSGITDFINNLLEIGQKVDVTIQLPASQ